MSNNTKILSVALAVTKATGNYPKTTDLARNGITRDMVRRAYGNMDGLYSAIAEQDVLFDLERSEYNKTIPKSAKRFVVVTAVTGAPVDKNALASVRRYCSEFNAKLLVLVSMSSSANQVLDQALREEIIITEDTALNKKLSILGIKNGAKRADPITGLPRVGQRNGSIICPSPKQRLRFVATGTDTLPHALMSPGAITKANYLTKTSLMDQTSYVANEDHVMGGLIVELENEVYYHFRQIQFNKRGGFVDLGTEISPDKVSTMAPAALVLGDLHSGETDPAVIKCLTKLSDSIKVPTWILHDVFNGKSISHYLENKSVTKARMSAEGALSLRSELDGLVADLDSMAQRRNLVIVKSNHDEWVDSYLQGGRYVNDPQNHRIALELAADLVDGLDPIEQYFARNRKSREIRSTNSSLRSVKWLKRDESYKVAGIELGQHGDLGSNGARGSDVSMEAAYGSCVYGHTHTPNILRSAWCVGTSTFLRVGYNRGASSWFQTACLVYPNGQRQLINIVRGKCTTRSL